MAIEEACLPWEPIPEEANKEWQVDVVHLEETPTNPGEDLSLVIAAAWGDDTGNEPSRGAWQLSFRRVYAFRKRFYGDAGNLSLTRPNREKATWEIFPSRYLEESSAPNGISLT